MFSINILTWFFGHCVGTDAGGNRYYQTKRLYRGRHRRWVIYKDQAEGSKVASDWHAWLHHNSDTCPGPLDAVRYAWQKPHLANMSGTPDAVMPSHKASPDAAPGSYTAWSPPST